MSRHVLPRGGFLFRSTSQNMIALPILELACVLVRFDHELSSAFRERFLRQSLESTANGLPADTPRSPHPPRESAPQLRL
jgi:hypothetical protein